MTNRPYQNEDDFQAMINLLLRCRATNPISRWPTVAELRLLCHPERDDCIKHLWLTEENALAAFALTFRTYAGLYFYLDPQRGQDTALAEQILAWAIATQRRLNPDFTTLTCQVRAEDTKRTAFLATQGFQHQERHTVRMIRDLTGALPPPQLPPGFTIRPVAGEAEAAARATLHAQAFGRETATAEDVADRLVLMRDPGYVADLDLVVIAPDGALVAFCVGSIDQEENHRRNCREGWTDPVGVHPGYQRRGLGKAVVLAACRRLRDFGMETALLGTGSWNTAMLGCAEAAGYQLLYQSLWYSQFGPKADAAALDQCSLKNLPRIGVL
ncbi:MAG: GNAT family N-acetyltransferase [Caldilineaceae bacterium]